MSVQIWRASFALDNTGAINRLDEELQETETFFTFFSLRLSTIQI